MRVSFIIPHKGREEMLEQTIQSILNLETVREQIEIIVVTQNKTLESTFIKQHAAQVSILFQPAHTTISASRNAGAREASGEYLAFIDADIELSRNWLQVMLEELRAHSERALTSAVQQYREERTTTIEKVKVALYSTLADSTVKFLGGANLFLHRQTFENAGGFPEELATCEDYYFTDRVRQHGDVYCTSQASFIHLGEDKNFREVFRKEIWRGQANLNSLRGRKIPLREIPSIITPLWETLTFLTTVIAFMFGAFGFGIAAIILFFLPILLYAVRLYNIGKTLLRFSDAFRFYSVYLPARAIGTITGFFKIISG